MLQLLRLQEGHLLLADEGQRRVNQLLHLLLMDEGSRHRVGPQQVSKLPVA